ncbi:MAG: cation:proton antiporter [Rikenellaceae bacterium]|nr:cation:proton antiporter [Rikenellaceae bacterium]
MLTSLAYIFLLGLALGYIFKKLRLPSLIGMLLTGIILGPYALNALSPTLLGISAELRQIALIIILMRAGLALDIKDLRKVGRPAILMSIIPATLEITGMILIAPPLLGITTLEAALMGTIIAAVSPAIIVPKMLYLIENKIGTRKSIPQMIMAAGSVDDVYVIILFTSMLTLSTGGNFETINLLQIPISVITGLLLGSATGFALTMFFKKIHMRDSIKVVIMMSFAFLFLAAEEWLKSTISISGLLAVVAMGATILYTYPLLANRISPKFSKLWVAAEILLFVLVGATVDIKFAAAAGLSAIAVIIFVLVFRMAGVFLSLIKTRLNLKERLFCMIAYLPKATVQAAIGSIPLAMGLPSGNIILTVAVLSILITAPLGAWAIDTTYPHLLTNNKPLTPNTPHLPTDNTDNTDNTDASLG